MLLCFDARVVKRNGDNEAGPEKQANSGSVRDDKGRFRKGVSGNPGGVTPGPKLTPILRQALNELHDTGDKTRAEALIQVGIEAAMNGNFQYWKELYDRIDGKVVERAIIGMQETDVEIEWPD